MKINASQQAEIKDYLRQTVVAEKYTEELYDHMLTALEQLPADSIFRLSKVKEMISEQFAELTATPADKKYFRRRNIFGGWLMFAIALLVYWSTMEPTASFWDCGEFIASAYRLQVGHQPGAPLFWMTGKMFSLLAMGNPANIAYWVNFSAAISSAATIMFLFWTITAMGCKIYRQQNIRSHTWGILAAGAVGALAFTFSDTFWFSAVEAEVYALSALFTAVTFWAVLKWESQGDDRWLVFIALIIGLSTGVHLLNLLAIPAVVMVWYFKKTTRVTLSGMILAFLAGCLLVALVQFVLIQYLVLLAAWFDYFSVNILGLHYGSGALGFLLLVAAVLTAGIRLSIRRKKYLLNLSLICISCLLLGFSSYMLLIIRADAKTNLNLSNPDNAFSLYFYLGRGNYGSTPLLYGNTFDAKATANIPAGNTYRKGKSRYEVSGKTYKTIYDKNLVFPRTYSQKPGHAAFYRDWLGLQQGESPTAIQNLQFFSSWQLGFMYWRYFLWNFAGRQNDIQGQGERMNGNWLTGIGVLDTMRLGNQQELPASIAHNEGHHEYYAFPLLLGIAGLIWLIRKNRQDAVVVLTLFFFTGIAIVLYLNQDPMQPRERDYAYAGSFYAFSICIGFGVLALKTLLQKIAPAKFSLAAAALISIATVPVLMGLQNHKDHDRSTKYTATDWAKNFLNGCAKDAILFTNADNDTFPLWYAQEVEGFRRDIRVICLQYLPDAAYISQLKKQVNQSAPLPLHLAEEKYADGVRDYLPYMDYGLKDSVELQDMMAVMTSDLQQDQVQMSDGSWMNFLPGRKFKLTIDPEQLLRTHTILPSEKARVTSAMQWTFDKDYLSKGDLALLDILMNNNWERPIYFSSHAGKESYMGLDRYLYQEGYAYRLLPFQTGPGAPDSSEQTHTDVAYTNMMKRMDFSGFKKAGYLDPESRRVLSMTWELSNTLGRNLLLENKKTAAANLMQKSLRDLPLRNYTVTDTLNRIYTVQNLYALQQHSLAKKLTADTADFLQQEFSYAATLAPEQQREYLNEIKFGLSILNSLSRMAADYQEAAVSKKVSAQCKQLADLFGIIV